MQKLVKWTGRILLSILLLFILLIFGIHSAPVKNFIRKKLENYLIAKTGVEVHISAVNYRLPRWAELDGVFLKDKTGDTLVYGNQIRVDINMWKLLKGQYEIRRVALETVTIRVSRKPNDSSFNYQFLIDAFVPKSAPSEKKSTFSLSLDEAELTNCRFSWKDMYGGQLIETNIGQLNLQNFTAGSLQQMALNKFKIHNSSFSIDLPAKKKINGFDINHIKLAGLDAFVTGIVYATQSKKLLIESMSLKEQSGFVLDSLHGNMDIQDTMIIAKNILIKTPASRITGNAAIYPASFDALYKGNAQNHIVLNNNVLAKNDIMLFAPFLINQYKKQWQGITEVYINADLAGNANRTLIKTIAVHSNKNDVTLNASGTISNLLSFQHLQYDLFIEKASAVKNFIDPFVNTKGKQNIALPPFITASGKVKGDTKKLTADLSVSSTYGIAFLKGRLSHFTKPEKLQYNMRLLAKDLETGKWVGNDSLSGKLNGTIIIKGSGIDYKTASVESEIQLNSYRLKEHLYKGINFKVHGTSGVYDVKGNIADSLLWLNMNMNIALNQQYPAFIGKLAIKNADPYKLKLYKDPLHFRALIDIQAKDITPEKLNALLRLDSVIVFKDNTTFHIDSLLVKGLIDSGKTLLSLNASFADATLKGTYKYNELPGIFQYYMAKYSKTEIRPVLQASPVNLDMRVDVKPDPIYALLLPGLFFDKNIHANGRINTQPKDSTLYFYLTAPLLVYKSNRLTNLQVGVNGINDSVKYSFQVDTARASAFRLYTSSLSGGIGNGHFSAAFVTNDSKKKEKYAAAVTGTVANNTYLIHLTDKLKLNYTDWKVDTENSLKYGPQGINISRFTISKGDENISVNSSTAAPNAPVDIKVNRFALTDITALLDKDSLEIGGMLSAQVKAEGLDKPVILFDGTVKVDSLTYQNQVVGNITVDAKTDNNEAVVFTGKLTGSTNKVALKGNYNQDKIDAELSMDPIEVKTIEPFTHHNLTRSSGTVSGKINITGKVSSPEWKGSLRFDSVFTQLSNYGTVFKINGQKIDLQYPAISFNQFTIKDSLDHSLTIDGNIKQESDAFTTALSVKATDFTTLDNTIIANNELFGKAIVDVDVTIAGPAAAPDITGSLALKDKSQVTFVRQQTVASAKDRETVMQFVNMDTIKNIVFKPADSVTQKLHITKSMLNYNLNIDINKNAKFTIIIDPLTRDELRIQGAGQLNAGVNPNGDVSITGAYNLSKGSYQLNYKFIKKKFDLKEGSTILLSGDPADAVADITAIYEIEASPYDLISNEISDNINSASYRQKVPFQVILKITGPITQPVLVFDVQLKDKVSGVNSDMTTTIDNKLLQMRTDPSAMNKQVFALLVMGRFIGEQSRDFFASGGDGLSADAVVKESVSRFLSDAVSQIAADLIKGVDIDVNLRTVDNYSDATQRTDLNLALSKRFLNDRLTINVGKSFTVDGEDPLAKGQDNSNVQFLPDVTTTYKLSTDGRYMLKAYQKSEYETILDGYFIETGVAFTLSLDYDKFNEILRKKKK
jgi:hypothetical protein